MFTILTIDICLEQMAAPADKSIGKPDTEVYPVAPAVDSPNNHLQLVGIRQKKKKKK